MLLWNPAQPVINSNIFLACTQAPVTTGAGLSTTVATIALSNNIANTKNLVLLNATWAFTTAAAAAVAIALVGNFNAATNVTHTTPLLIQSGLINTVGAVGVLTRAVGTADTAATLPTAPVFYLPLQASGTSGLGPTNVVTDLAGLFVIPPGGYVAIQANAAAVGLASFMWAEIPFLV